MIFAYMPVNAYATESLPPKKMRIFRKNNLKQKKLKTQKLKELKIQTHQKLRELKKTESFKPRRVKQKETNSSTETEYDEKTELALKE